MNQWTHGTQITASHGHWAFFGAYGALALAALYLILPQLSGLKAFNQTRAMWGFWLMNAGMLGMVLALTVAGVLQTYLWRMLGMDFMVVRDQYLAFWMVWRFVFGVGMFIPGVLILIWDFFALGRKPAEQAVSTEAHEPAIG